MSDLKDLEFDSRETYLTWKATWKQEYFALARRIRKAKRHYRSPHRQFLHMNGFDPVYSEGINGFAAMFEIHGLKAQARDMLELRHESKRKAGAQWAAVHAAR